MTRTFAGGTGGSGGGGAGADGDNGWSPVFAAVSDGARRVLQISDWTGGEGTKPPVGRYVSATGLTTVLADAIDVRGAQGAAGSAGSAGAAGAAGADGNDGWVPVLAVATDGARRVLQVSDWTGGEGTKPTTGEYIGASGLVSSAASAVDVRGSTGAQGPAGNSEGRVLTTVRYATTAPRTLSGLTGTAMDGVAPSNGDRVLVAFNSTYSENRIYIARSGAWEVDTSFGATEADAGALVVVRDGDMYGGTLWEFRYATVAWYPLTGPWSLNGDTRNATATGLKGNNRVLSVNFGRAANQVWGRDVQYYDFPEGSAPSNPANTDARVYAYDDAGITRLAFRDSNGLVSRIAGDDYFVVRNDTGSTIAKGVAVGVQSAYTTGGVWPRVAPLVTASGASAIGLTTASIANGAFGVVCARGQIDNVDTSAWSSGQALYLSDSVAGGLRNTHPSTFVQKIGHVLVSNATTGSILVNVAPQEVAVSGAGSGVTWVLPARVVATSNLTLSGFQTIDGVTLSNGDIILAAGQTTASERRLYYARTGAWQLVTEFDQTYEILVNVDDGTTYSGTLWRWDADDSTWRLPRTTVSARSQRTAGNVTINSTSWMNVDTAMDLTIYGVAVGDVIEASVNLFWESASVYGIIDVCTVVSGSAVNYFTGHAGDNTKYGIAGLLGGSTMGEHAVGATVQYALQSGDISGGAVTLRLRGRVSGSSRGIYAATHVPLGFSAKRL